MHQVIGLTGGIGSGKSSVADFLKKSLGWAHVDADIICKHLLRKGNQGWQAFIEVFGNRFLDADENIDRPALRQAIFAEAAIRRQVNQIVHPLARRDILQMIKTFKTKLEPGLMVVEAPLLFEANWQTDFDKSIVVYAEKNKRIERLMIRDNINLEQAEAAIASQQTLAEKTMLADHVIDNSGPWPETCLQLVRLGQVLQG